MTAGSKPRRLASIGRVQPMSLAMTMVKKMVSATTDATVASFRSSSITLPKTTTPRVRAHRTDTRSSFQITRSQSANSTSPRDIARIMVTDACPPELPPVSISIGMNRVRAALAARASSKKPRMVPVKVAEIISSSSQGMRCFQVSTTPVWKYGLSVGRMAAIFSMSSVASSSITSMASSTVMMPTSRSSPSTTGRAVRSYLEKSWATSSLSSWVGTDTTLVSMISLILVS